jgi:hypothetical protein
MDWRTNQPKTPKKGHFNPYLCTNGKFYLLLLETIFFSLSPTLISFSFLILQSIIRGLRESGVFTSAITNARRLSKQKSAVGNPSNSTITNTGDDTTKHSAEGSESQATRRKILESSIVHEEAIPPVSPPGLFKDMLMRT